MKFRSGFVSNSSSASFIAGIAVISNIDKFMAWVNKNNVRVEVKLLSDIISDRDNPRFDGHNVYYEGFNGKRVSVNTMVADESLPPNEAAKQLLTATENPYIAWFDESGDTPPWNEDRDEYEYDSVNLDWFEKSHQDLFKMFDNNNIPGVAKSAAFMGAGRDG